MHVLTNDQLAGWERDGHLLATGLFDAATLDSLREWASAIAVVRPGPEDDNPVLQHFEATQNGAVLARSENFTQRLSGLRDLVTTGSIAQAAAQLMGEPALLYKEKINYKHPGGAGFEPHQDATAYKFVDLHITCMIAVDAATPDNGCLEVAASYHRSLLPTNGDGCINPAEANELLFSAIPMAPGDVLWFHSRTPHRSADNRSSSSRRALFLTFNAAAEGDLRSAYYADKVEQLRQFDASSAAAPERARVSTIGHFRGRQPSQ